MAKNKMMSLALTDIYIPPAWNARSGDWTKVKDPETGEGWEAFVASIKSEGVKSNLEVRPVTDGKRKEAYELIAGFRRYQAAKEVGLTEVPCTIYADMAEIDARIRNIQENTSRESLKGADLAWALKEASKLDDKLTQKVLADKVGLSQPYVGKLLKIQSEVLPKILKEWRAAVIDISVAEVYRLVTVPKDLQEGEWAKLIANKAPVVGEDAERGKDSWMKTMKKKCERLGNELGVLQRLEFIELHPDIDWVRIVEEVITIRSTAKKAQKNTCARLLAKGFENGMKEPPPEEGEDEGEEE